MHRTSFYLCFFVSVFVATACGRTATNEQRRPSIRADDEPATPSDDAEASTDALRVACEAACNWARACCIPGEQSCALSDCESSCLTQFGAGTTQTCERLATAALECLVETTCEWGTNVVCASEQDAFDREGCAPETASESSVHAQPAMAVPDTNGTQPQPDIPAATDPIPTVVMPDLEPGPAPVVDAGLALPAPDEPALGADAGPPLPSTDGPAFATVASIFDQNCTVSCHEPGGILGGPGGIDSNAMHDLTTTASYETLTTRRSLQVPSMWLVGSGLEDSYLWHKLQGTQETVGGSGVSMPLSGALTAEELDAIRAWIEGGASP